MKIALTFALISLPLLAAPADQSRWQYEDSETIHKTFSVAAGDNASKLIVDQINGYVHVTGGSGSQIDVTVERRNRAESQDRLSYAKQNVKLDITQDGNTVKLYEDSPRRHDSDGNDGYSVIFDCEIKVPTGVALDLHTLNNSIQVKDTGGDFKVHALNGKIDMQNVGGSGSVETLNGSVKVAFTRNPAHDSSFKTLNGSIDLYFASNPDADFQLQTLHGGVYSDFDVTTVPTTIKGGSMANGFVYRSGGSMKVRAGKGGIAIDLHTLNGSIRLHSKP